MARNGPWHSTIPSGMTSGSSMPLFYEVVPHVAVHHSPFLRTCRARSGLTPEGLSDDPEHHSLGVGLPQGLVSLIEQF
jgi:hypothetical protein